MKKLFLLFSHKLTNDQINDAKDRLNIIEYRYLPDNLQNIWSNIPEDDENIEMLFMDYIKENASIGDYILIEGEYGIVYKMVKWSIENNYIPIYSYTKRQYKSITLEDGTVENRHYFKHIKFKEYK